MQSKGFISILLIVAAVVAMLSVAAYFTAVQNNVLPIYTPFIKPNPVVCTQEAKQCPDGSYVSRTGPKCEFAKCPEPKIETCPAGTVQTGTTNSVPPQPICEPITSVGSLVFMKEGKRVGSLLVQKIYSDYITGLNYREYPVASMYGSPITLRIGETASNGCTVTMTLKAIQGDTALFVKKEDYTKPCPICLAGDTLIDTPSGEITVKDLKIGGSIWTTDLFGRRIEETVQKISKTSVPPDHQMVNLILGDGREVLISPGHPTVDGRAVGDLLAGDAYDGSFVKSTKLVPYGQSFTYDILPSGQTGFYWADGILLGSTLK